VGIQQARPYIPLALVAVAVVALDQWTKAAITNYIGAHHGQSLKLLGGKVVIDLVHNRGAAFGILPNQTFLFVAIAVVVIVAIIASYRRVVQGSLWFRLALGLILGGAVGNLIDRLRLGYVVDFIDLRWWPVFNIADSCIVIGVALLVLTLGQQMERS
jgi:signal peptidase II